MYLLACEAAQAGAKDLESWAAVAIIAIICLFWFGLLWLVVR